ncbi:MAG TPA: mechanosensitive ion channel family protein [Candidatus Acidoferrales bacterium]|nr:mechanosensitive ion channel family protein [Candidatus Acidoferrales bacterium]
MIQFFLRNWNNLLWSAVTLAIAIVIALVVHFVVFWLLRRLAQRKGAYLQQSLAKRGQRPARWIFPLLAVLIVLPGLPLPEKLMSALEHITGIGLIAAIAWLIILASEITSDVLANRYRIDVADNLLARRIQTQFSVLHRIVVVVVSLVALAIVLMTFPAINHIGMSLLASAGLAGLIVGLAMKGTLSNLIAGIQIAFTQPFRLEDAVVVEGQWGWIEEIGTMYVVVRIWDLRRLVLPLSYFLDHPFENWTRTSAEVLAHFFIYVDYTVPVEEARQELRRILESTPLWAGKVCVMQISDFSETTAQLRAVMDARNSSDSWDLQCYVREKLIDYLREKYPESLPRYRAELDSKDGSDGQSGEGASRPLAASAPAETPPQKGRS